MAGPVRRPTLRELRPDWRTVRFFSRIGVKALGDDGLLKAVIAELETEGFHIVGAHSILGELLAAGGIWGRIVPMSRPKPISPVGWRSPRNWPSGCRSGGGGAAGHRAWRRGRRRHRRPHCPLRRP